MDKTDPRYETLFNEAAEAAAQRKPGADIVQDLMARHGVTEPDAKSVLQDVRAMQREAAVQSAASGASSDNGGGVAGVLGFIGIIVLLNVLSQVFEWGWVFY